MVKIIFKKPGHFFISKSFFQSPDQSLKSLHATWNLSFDNDVRETL